MILRLDVPMTNPTLTGGTVKEWHKADGDVIGFGEAICTVTYDEFAFLQRTARATVLAGRKSKRFENNRKSRTGEAVIDVVISAAEQGILGKIFLGPGDRFAVGDTLAVISTTPIDHFSLPEDLAGLAMMRVATNESDESEMI